MNTTSEMQLVPIDKLIPYVNNARTHPPEQLNKLRSSLREFGFINPVIIDRDFNVIAGHGRILAAKAENISEVPCVFVDYLTPAQKKAYIIADNRMALDAGWDEEMLKVEIESLQADDFDLGLTGFDEKELAAFFDDDSDTKDDDFDVDAEMEKPCITKPGDLWLLGNHRLVCGDSTKQETYEVLMNGKQANLVVTDPPYNVNYEGSAGKIKNDNLENDKFYQFLLDAFTCMEKVMANDARARTSGASLKACAGSRTKPFLFFDMRNGQPQATSWQTVFPSPGECLTRNTGEYPREENASSLSQILTAQVPEKYYLSPKACRGILQRASKRGKELPPLLKAALERQAQSA